MKLYAKLNLAAGALFFFAMGIAFIASGRLALLLDVPAVLLMVASEIVRRKNL